MTPAINVQSDEQRMSNLALANAVRCANGQTLKEITAMSVVDGIDTVIAVLRSEDTAAYIEAVPIVRLLMAPRKFGESRAKDLLRAAGVMSGDRKLRHLSRRQRLILASRLEHPESMWPGTIIPRLRLDRDRAAA